MAELFSYIDPRGIETLLNDGTYRVLVSHVGLGMQVAAPVSERTPARDGTSYYGIYTPSRDIAIGLFMQYTTMDALTQAERVLRSLVSPYVTSAATLEQACGTLRVMRAGATRDIDALCVGYDEASTNREVFAATRMLRFWCPSPFWYDPVLASFTYALPTSLGLSVPMSIPLSLAAGAATGSVWVTNTGDVDSWPTIIIDGPSDSPTITNVTTGKVLTITQALDASDSIAVDMENATVYFYDSSTGITTDIRSGMSAASEFWPLVPGENEISIGVSNPAGGSVSIQFYNRYLGA